MNSRPAIVIALFLTSLLLAPAFASAEADEGFYFGCAANVLTIQGTGSWGGEGFDLTAPLPGSGENDIGLNWSEKLLFGLKPSFGYRFGSGLAVQASVTGSVPVNSFQAYSRYEGGITYDQSADVDWSQQSAEAVVKYYPSSDWHVYVYGGVQYIRVSVDLVAAEGVEQVLTNGQVITNTDIYKDSADMNTIGGLVGVGIEFPSESMNLTAYGAIQYSLADVESDEFIFDTNDFQADVGGFSVLFGLKMNLFQN